MSRASRLEHAKQLYFILRIEVGDSQHRGTTPLEEFDAHQEVSLFFFARFWSSILDQKHLTGADMANRCLSAFWRKCIVMVQHSLLKITDHIDRAAPPAHSSIILSGKF